MRGALHTIRCLLFGYCRVKICERYDKRPNVMCLAMQHPLSTQTSLERVRDEVVRVNAERGKVTR